MTLWVDDRVLLQAQIASDFLTRRASIALTKASLWVLGFPVPSDAMKSFFEARASSFHPLMGERPPHDENELWGQIERFVKREARIRGGQANDDEGTALYQTFGALLELLFGIGEGGVPQSGSRVQWITDTAGELLDQHNCLSHYPPAAPWTEPWADLRKRLPPLKRSTVEELTQFVLEVASLPRQLAAIRTATPHDWLRARRIAVVLVNRHDKWLAFTEADYDAKRPMLARATVNWLRALFPILLSAVTSRKDLIGVVFSISSALRTQEPQQPLSKSLRKFSL